ncbi:hypothetical protein [Streptomyces sp. NPDC048644]|uniref:hypothetical protein n=1 Tax=Streptomyces sp. NPDC048644 TaxID=3365582 RepID=UPI003722791D
MKKHNSRTEGPDGLACTARLPLSSATSNYLAEVIRGHCKKIRSPWRALPAGKIAGIVLAVLRCDQRPGDLAGRAQLRPSEELARPRQSPHESEVGDRAGTALLVLTNQEVAADG